MQKQPNSRMCFVCGIDNPIGLKVFFYEDDEGRVIAKFTPREEHQGYPGFVHGGIIAALMDETIGRVVTSYDIWAVTAKLELKFRRPVPLGEQLTVIGELVRLRSRAFEARGELRLADGALAVEGYGLYVRLPDEEIERRKAALDFWEVVPDSE
ncbi:MAG TPA: PaaI family thioesterase [Anaerolineae bacterium]|nr:PaaI family thioesterase [Anaerolineae bacterium]